MQNLGISRSLTYSKLETYSKPWYIQNSDIFKIRNIFRTLAYPEKHIQNLGISRALTYTKLEIYSKPWYIQNPEIFKIRNLFRTLVYPKP